MLILTLHRARFLPFYVGLNILKFTRFSKQVLIEEFHSKTIQNNNLRLFYEEKQRKNKKGLTAKANLFIRDKS